MKVYAILRPTRNHTEFHGVTDTKEYAQFKADEANKTYPRGARFVVSEVTVQRDPAR